MTGRAVAETQVRVVITGDARSAQSAVEKLKAEFGSLGTAASSLKSTLAGIGVGISLGAITVAFRGAITELDAFNDAAESTGISVEKLSGLVTELAPAGVSLEQLTDIAGRMTRAMTGAEDETGKAAEAFRALGVSTRDAAGNLRPTDDVLREVARSLQQYEDGTNKTAIAQALFGKSGAALIPVLNDIAATTGQAGGVTAEMAQRAEAAQRQINGLQRAALDLRNELVVALIPGLLDLIEQLKAGTQAAGGFWSALLRYGTANPFKSAGDQISALIERRDELNKRLASEEAATTAGGAFGGGARKRAAENAERLRGELAQLERDLGYWRTVQGQAIDIVDGNGDARDARMRPAPLGQAPGLSGGGSRAGARSGADAAVQSAARLYDSQIKALYATQELTAAQKLALELALQAAPLEVRASEERAFAAAELADVYKRTADERAEAIKAATKAEEDDYKTLAKLTADAREEREKLVRSYRDLIDPMEQYRQKLQEITRLEALGEEDGLSSQEAQRAREVIIEQMDRAGQEAEKLRDTGKDAFAELQRAVEGWGDRSADAITELVMTGQGGFRKMVDSILADLLRLQIQQTVTRPLFTALQAGLGSLFGAALEPTGAVLSGDSALSLSGADIRARRAGGGDMRAGYPYLVGERGTPEVIVPRMDATAMPWELMRAAMARKSAEPTASAQPIVVQQTLNVGPSADYAMVRQAAALGAAQAQRQYVDARRRGQRWAT